MGKVTSTPRYSRSICRSRFVYLWAKTACSPTLSRFIGFKHSGHTTGQIGLILDSQHSESNCLRTLQENSTYECSSFSPNYDICPQIEKEMCATASDNCERHSQAVSHAMDAPSCASPKQVLKY